MSRSLCLAALCLATSLPICPQIAGRSGRDAEQRTSGKMEALKADPLRLREFLKAMPKGGDLHNHLSGAVYAESYLQWAAEDGDCVDTTTFTIVHPPQANACAAGQTSVAAALKNPALDDSLLTAMSMYQYLPARTHDSAHDHFFASFPRFDAVLATHWGDMLEEVTERAAAQNELYLELILGIDRNQAGAYGEKVAWTDSLDQDYKAIKATGVDSLVPTMRQRLDDAEKQWRERAHCSSKKQVVTNGCGVEVRYIYEIYRAMSPQHVFAQMIAGFELADADPRVVAINLVQPEDWYVPMHDHALHMRMIDFLHKRYPKVHITLHAGELAPGFVPYEGLCCHIRDAVERGDAERIGHGVDVMYENEAPELLREMAEKHIAVEINLTSNRIILGVSGKMHPLREYIRAGVPVVLSTDDEGVSRAEMTDEYMQAVLDQQMSYQQLKQAARDSITYSFADEATKKKLMVELQQRCAEFENAQ